MATKKSLIENGGIENIRGMIKMPDETIYAAKPSDDGGGHYYDGEIYNSDDVPMCIDFDPVSEIRNFTLDEMVDGLEPSALGDFLKRFSGLEKIFLTIEVTKALVEVAYEMEDFVAAENLKLAICFMRIVSANICKTLPRNEKLQKLWQPIDNFNN